LGKDEAGDRNGLLHVQGDVLKLQVIAFHESGESALRIRLAVDVDAFLVKVDRLLQLAFRHRGFRHDGQGLGLLRTEPALAMDMKGRRHGIVQAAPAQEVLRQVLPITDISAGLRNNQLPPIAAAEFPRPFRQEELLEPRVDTFQFLPAFHGLEAFCQGMETVLQEGHLVVEIREDERRVDQRTGHVVLAHGRRRRRQASQQDDQEQRGGSHGVRFLIGGVPNSMEAAWSNYG
jgi:hypothetical protein